MGVAVTINIHLGQLGEYHFQQQLGTMTQPSHNGNGKPPEPGRIVPQTSSVIAPGLARQLPA